MEVSITFAKAHFSRLVRLVEGGKEITITRQGIAVVRMVPFVVKSRRGKSLQKKESRRRKAFSR